MSSNHHRILCALLLSVSAAACGHAQVATVLPKGQASYEIVAQSADEATAFRNAESEARYTCEKQEKELVVKDQQSLYQGADKNSQGDIGGENVALAFVTGKTGKERSKDDYKVTLLIECL